LELNVGECSASHPGRLIPGEKALNTSIHIDPKDTGSAMLHIALLALCWSVLLFVKKKCQ